MLVVVSYPESLRGEAAIINRLFESGLMHFHLRKPQCSEKEMEDLMAGIDPRYYSRIVLHQHHHLAPHFGITRIHFSEAARTSMEESAAFANGGLMRLSTSVHSYADYERLPKSFSYAFLGPVFDSISKAGYLAGDFKNDLSEKKNNPVKLIGIGGITKYNLKEPLSWGFDGLAVLGSIWQSGDPVSEFSAIHSEFNRCGVTH